MYWLRWHYHVKDIAGAPYKIKKKSKQKRQNRRQSVVGVAGRQQLYCAVQSRSPSHCQTTTRKYSLQLATVRSWQTTADICFLLSSCVDWRKITDDFTYQGHSLRSRSYFRGFKVTHQAILLRVVTFHLHFLVSKFFDCFRLVKEQCPLLMVLLYSHSFRIYFSYFRYLGSYILYCGRTIYQ